MLEQDEAELVDARQVGVCAGVRRGGGRERGAATARLDDGGAGAHAAAAAHKRMRVTLRSARAAALACRLAGVGRKLVLAPELEKSSADKTDKTDKTDKSDKPDKTDKSSAAKAADKADAPTAAVIAPITVLRLHNPVLTRRLRFSMAHSGGAAFAAT